MGLQGVRHDSCNTACMHACRGDKCSSQSSVSAPLSLSTSAPPSPPPLCCLTCVLRWHPHWCTCTDLREVRRKGQPRASSTWLEAQSPVASWLDPGKASQSTCESITFSPGPKCTPARRRRWMHTAKPSSSSHSTTPPLAMTSGRFKAAHSCSRVHGLCVLGCWAARSMACSGGEFELRMRQ